MKQRLSSRILHQFRKMCHRFGSDKKGNVAAIFAFAAVPLFMLAGASLDYSRSLDAKTQMQSVADLSVVAAAKELLQGDLTIAQAETLAENTFNTQITGNPRYAGLLKKVTPKAVATKGKVDGVTTTTVTLSATAEIDLVLASIGGDLKLFDIGVNAVAETSAESLGAISMYFVLDKSGSMYGSKIADLKKATKDLLNQLKTADPDRKYVRTGAAAYNTTVNSSQKIVWGTSKVDTYTQALSAGGGTNTSAGTSLAVAALKHRREKRQHKKKNEQEPQKFMLVMTDGSNNYSSWDTHTLADCTDAKNNGIEVYTVAFKAPSRGKTLLKNCASSIGHYFDATQSAQLVAAFREIGARVAAAVPRVTK